MKVNIKLFGTEHYLEIDGQPKKFDKESSDLLTGPIKGVDPRREGIFDSSIMPVVFCLGQFKISVVFGQNYYYQARDKGVQTAILERISIVKKAFENAEVERQEWEFEIGSKTEPEIAKPKNLLRNSVYGAQVVAISPIAYPRLAISPGTIGEFEGFLSGSLTKAEIRWPNGPVGQCGVAELNQNFVFLLFKK